MARSAIMQALLRAYRNARIAKSRGIPFGEVGELERARRLHRRDVLKLGAASASLAACNITTADVPPPVDPASRSDVIIVGGGLAGLTCAYRLREAEVSCRLFEAAAELGGRVRSDRETFAGMHCELGGELIDSGHVTMLALARELEIELLDYREDALDGRWVLHADGQTTSAADLSAELAAFGETVALAQARLWDPESGVTRANPNGGAALDMQSIAQFLDKAGTQGTLRKLIDVAFTTEFGLDIDASNALNLVLLFEGEDLYGASDERFHAKDGNSTFVEKLAAALPEDTVVPRSILRAMRPRSDGRVQLTFDQEGTTTEVSALHVVLAIPFTTLRDVDVAPELFTDLKRRSVREMGYGQNSKVIVGFQSTPWRVAGSSGDTFTDLGYQSTWETSRLQGSSEGIITSFLGGKRARDVKPDDRAAERARFLDEFDMVFPGSKAAANESLAIAYWPGNPWSKGSYSSPLVGELTAIGGEASAAVNNVHFAGEHTSEVASGYMEGAAESGERAATEIAEALGVELTRPSSPRMVRLR